jgi:glucose/arabinose dehydrogenase
VRAERVADGFASPVGFEVAAGVDDRWFVVDQAGQVYVVGPDGVRDEPMLDVTDRMVDLGGYTERGLLGLAFHPEFASDRRCFVRYSAPPREGTPDGYSHTFVLAAFEVDDDLRADPGSERALLELPQPQSNHDAGSVVFGPDGYLYVGVGDGGGGGDTGSGHVEDWYDGVADGNGQDVTENLLGSVLRIEVDGQETVRGEQRNYAIPEDNPLVGKPGLDEQYAWGFRNPWRMSFDVRESGSDSRANQNAERSGDGEDLYVADVGQSAWEEVNLVEAGGNYGWNVREGAHCFRADDCPTSAPDEPPYDGQPLVDPIIEYPNGDADGPSGAAVIGGYRYRGDGVPAFDGGYVFGDWRWGREVFVARPADEGQWRVEAVPVEGDMGGRLLAFGRDRAGELYVLTTDGSGVGGSAGAVHRLVGDGPRTDPDGEQTTGRTTVSDGQAGPGVAGALGALGAGALAASRLR